MTQCTSQHPGLPQTGVVPNSIPFPLKSLDLGGKAISSTGKRRGTCIYCISVLEVQGISVCGGEQCSGRWGERFREGTFEFRWHSGLLDGQEAVPGRRPGGVDSRGEGRWPAPVDARVMPPFPAGTILPDLASLPSAQSRGTTLRGCVGCTQVRPLETPWQLGVTSWGWARSPGLPAATGGAERHVHSWPAPVPRTGKHANNPNRGIKHSIDFLILAAAAVFLESNLFPKKNPQARHFLWETLHFPETTF